MKTIRNKENIEFISEDEYGEFMFRICYIGRMQFQLHTCDDEDDTYCNIDLVELKEIQKMINEVIKLKEDESNTGI